MREREREGLQSSSKNEIDYGGRWRIIIGVDNALCVFLQRYCDLAVWESSIFIDTNNIHINILFIWI